MANENASYKTKKDSILCVFRLANTVCFSFSSIPFLGIGKKKSTMNLTNRTANEGGVRASLCVGSNGRRKNV